MQTILQQNISCTILKYNQKWLILKVKLNKKQYDVIKTKQRKNAIQRINVEVNIEKQKLITSKPKCYLEKGQQY